MAYNKIWAVLYGKRLLIAENRTVASRYYLGFQSRREKGGYGMKSHATMVE